MPSLLKQINKKLNIVEADEGESLPDLETLTPYQQLQRIVAPYYSDAHDRFTKQKVKPWTLGEIIDALMPVIKKEAWMAAKKDTGYNTARARDLYDDFIQLGALGLTKALEAGLDQGREGNSFISWAVPHIQSAIRNGVGGTGAHRSARGAINRMMSGKPKDIKAEIDRIGPEHYTKHSGIMGVTDDNPFGQFAPDIYSIGTQLLNATDPGTKEDALKRLDHLLNKIEDDETMIPGSSTGASRVISTPHSGKDVEEFKKTVRVKSMSAPTRGSGGEEGEINVIDVEKAPEKGSFRQAIASSELFTKLIELARKGYPYKDFGPVYPLTIQEFRWLIRRYGIDNYPGKGTADDVEVDPVTGKKSQWVEMGCPVMDISADKYERTARLEQGMPAIPGLRELAPTPNPGEEKPLSSTRASLIEKKSIEKLTAIAKIFKDDLMADDIEESTNIELLMVESILRSLRLLELEGIFTGFYR